MKNEIYLYIVSKSQVNNNYYRFRVFFKHLDASSKFSSGIYSKYCK